MSIIKQYSKDPVKGVDIGLTHTNTTEDVFWSNGNSYVVVESKSGEFTVEGKKVSLLSINGKGDVRWNFNGREYVNGLAKIAAGMDTHISPAEMEGLQAMDHFGLKYIQEKDNE